MYNTDTAIEQSKTIIDVNATVFLLACSLSDTYGTKNNISAVKLNIILLSLGKATRVARFDMPHLKIKGDNEMWTSLTKYLYA